MKRALLFVLLLCSPSIVQAQDRVRAEALASINCESGSPWEVFVVNASAADDCDSTGGGSSDAHCCCMSGTISACSSSSSSGNSFTTIDAPSGTDPVADSATDTLAFTATGDITITGDSSTDTVNFSVTSSGLTHQQVMARVAIMGGF